jgi:hypothetical protein|tara:strand:- start:699 stop:860 length:162 start_codon:yes stop_codon:yes gene_type:complete
MSVVKIVTNTPKNPPKAVMKEPVKEVKVPEGELKVQTASGMGAAKKGGKYLGV